jgi:hypothetical protein
MGDDTKYYSGNLKGIDQTWEGWYESVAETNITLYFQCKVVA